MATWRWLSPMFRQSAATFNILRSAVSRQRLSPAVLLGLGAAGVGGLVFHGGGRWWSGNSLSRRYSVYAAEQQDQPKEETKEDSGYARNRKQRFRMLASVEYEGELYMTPRDFLFSVIMESRDGHKQGEKRRCWKSNQQTQNAGGTQQARQQEDTEPHLPGKMKKKKLTKQDIDALMTRATKLKQTHHLFRDLGDEGLISYTEYLFLLGILTKPHTGFHIAFSMLDIDDNQRVEKKEFLMLQSIIGQKKEHKPEAHSASEINKEINTTLLVHFFGKEGNLKLQYKDFYRFMEDLQREVQEIEFREFSRGMKTMRREDFASWLLHFTEEQNRGTYWKNVTMKIPPGESISFEEFRAFYNFMNHLEDFAFTMNMFTAASRPVGIGQFKRAVKVATGQELSDNVLDTVFKIFDIDGDGCLSKQEFLAVIMTRLHRGFKAPTQHGLKGYFKCVKKETIAGVHEAWKQSGRSPC